MSRPEYMRAYRSDPVAAGLHRWSSRTINAARRELARRHRGEYARILSEIRESDPRPGAAEKAATDLAA
jgi:hypothetical protein